jgi:hypothetical protein
MDLFWYLFGLAIACHLVTVLSLREESFSESGLPSRICHGLVFKVGLKLGYSGENTNGS